jgi:hypothetical protein
MRKPPWKRPTPASGEAYSVLATEWRLWRGLRSFPSRPYKGAIRPVQKFPGRQCPTAVDEGDLGPHFIGDLVRRVDLEIIL